AGADVGEAARARARERTGEGSLDVVEEGARLGIVEIGRAIVQDGEVSGLLEVAGDDEGEPEEVVGHPGDVTLLGARMPPVVDRAVGELMLRVQVDLPRAARRLDSEPDLRVLELIAKAVGAALLVVAGPAPEPRRDRLIAQPVVGE